MSLDDILIRIEKPVVTGAIAVLGALAVGIKAMDAANAWLRRRPVERL